MLLCARHLPAGSPTSHCPGKLSQSRQIPANMVALHQNCAWIVSVTGSLSDLRKERQEKLSNNWNKPKILVSVAYPFKLAFWNYCKTRDLFARWGAYKVCGVFRADFKSSSVVNLRSHLRAQHKTCIRKYFPGDPLREVMCLKIVICLASGGAERQKCHWFPLWAFTNISEMVLSPQQPLLEQSVTDNFHIGRAPFSSFIC